MRNKGWNLPGNFQLHFHYDGYCLIYFFVSVNKQEPKQGFYTLSNELVLIIF
jgi:hypothetical protein